MHVGRDELRRRQLPAVPAPGRKSRRTGPTVPVADLCGDRSLLPSAVQLTRVEKATSGNHCWSTQVPGPKSSIAIRKANIFASWFQPPRSRGFSILANRSTTWMTPVPIYAGTQRGGSLQCRARHRELTIAVAVYACNVDK